MGKAQRHAAQAARHRLDEKGRSREDSATRARPATPSRLIASRITANDSWLTSPRGTMSWALKIARIDLPGRNKSLDLDCAGVLRAGDRRSFLRQRLLFVLFALLFVIFGPILAPRAARHRRRPWPLHRRFVDRQGAGRRALTASLREVAVFDEQELVLADLVAARLVCCSDVFAGDGIDEPVAQRERRLQLSQSQSVDSRDSPPRFDLTDIALECSVPAFRPYWNGYLKLSFVSCPVALYPAASAAEKVSFRQVNRLTGHRLRHGAPGALPVKLRSAVIFSSLSVRSLFSAAFIPDVKPTWCNKPTSS